MWGVVPTMFGYQYESDRHPIPDNISNASYTLDGNTFRCVERYPKLLPEHSPVLICLAACHSLTLIDGELIGDPLDIKMFESTGWELEEAGKADTSKFDMLMPSVVRPPQEAENLNSFSTTLENVSGYPHEVGIIRQFTFSSTVARMSVVTRVLGDNHFHLYAKGAPEKLEELCTPQSIPDDFHRQLKHFAMQGYRVIGLAHRILPSNLSWHKVQKLKRNQVEKDMTFLGLLIMQNALKPETSPVIQELKHANVRTVMVTGDNLLTAVSVARDCKMLRSKDEVTIVEAQPPNSNHPFASIRFIQSDTQLPDEPTVDASQSVTDNNNELMVMEEAAVSVGRQLSDMEEGVRAINGKTNHFALDGKTWAIVKNYLPHLVPRLIQKGTIFARMAPDQKAQLVEALQSIDYIVAMCGDGANDCGALKAAHVGISLSEAEASVAAPFTSRIANITCVPKIIKEGRCALVTSFGVFKYMALYSMVQFVSVLLLYSVQTNLGDTQFLYIDLVITTTVAVFMGWTKPYDKLSKVRPPGSLVSGPNLFSIFAQIGLTIVSQVGAYLYLTSMPWYVPVQPSTPEQEITMDADTTTVFITSSFQYLVLAAAFSNGPPYRKAFYTNVRFALALFILTAFTVLLDIYPGPSLSKFLQIDSSLTANFRLCLLGFSAAYTVQCFFIEKVIVPSRWLKIFTQYLMGKKQPKNKFKLIQNDIEMEDWPPQNFDGDDVSNKVVQISPGLS